LPWAGDEAVALRALAVFLPFADNNVAVPPLTTRGHHSSFLSLARTCKRAYEVLTSDAACWSTQRLHFDLTEQLLDDRDFVPRHGVGRSRNRFVLRVDRLTARRREIMRRVLGVELFERLVAPHLSSIDSNVRLSYDPAKDDYYGVVRDEEGMATADVYPTFTRSVLADPELQRLLHLGAGDREPGWLPGCYSHLLLPDYIRLLPASNITLVLGLPSSSLTCLYALLQRLPGVECLTCERSEYSTMEMLPAWEWERLRTMLPRLRALSAVNVDMRWADVVRPLLTSELGELRELTIDSGYGCIVRCHKSFHSRRVAFHFPPRAFVPGQ